MPPSRGAAARAELCPPAGLGAGCGVGTQREPREAAAIPWAQRVGHAALPGTPASPSGSAPPPGPRPCVLPVPGGPCPAPHGAPGAGPRPRLFPVAAAQTACPAEFRGCCYFQQVTSPSSSWQEAGVQVADSCRLLLPFGCGCWPVAPPAALGAATRGSPKASTLAMLPHTSPATSQPSAPCSSSTAGSVMGCNILACEPCKPRWAP